MPSHAVLPRVLDAPAQVQCSFLELASWLWALAADLQMSLGMCFGTFGRGLWVFIESPQEDNLVHADLEL